MIITINPSALRQTTAFEYAIRFVFGGLVTGMAGVVAAIWGPVIGGLFLAFPAIFPASATLVEKHEDQRKEQHGLSGQRRGRKSAGSGAAGAVMGSIGLLAFGATIWALAPRLQPWVVLVGAVPIWFGVAALTWMFRKKLWPRWSAGGHPGV
jgi:hypothetical protein